MDLILGFLATHMSFLWRDARYSIVGSTVTTTDGGNAALDIESDTVRLRFVCDRRELMLDLQPTATTKDREWFSIDVVRRHFTGKPETSSLMDAGFAAFLEDHLAAVEDAFSEQNWEETARAMREVKRRRAKERLG